ncbi:hypothetical protein BDN72DRAFT_839771 [Pluteus cervinus]|uniref:Uncharacterized protein n=1 Tax=Pluteus cervinus TaxID=181527 RepID=A0ACD3AW29_9AGAR|nr:hypothetical protein BDN72DRAFT_839771 [Pluteus cervinus]
MNVILLGDFHQFPPVANPSAALYSDTHSTERSQRGRLLFKSFEVVVKLKQQMRVDDDIWWGILQRMREGARLGTTGTHNAEKCR